MLMNFFNEFINELKKEENKQQIIKAINPYLSIFSFYVNILICLFVILIMVQFFILYKIYNLSNF
jgi:hypothetical protein